jgi:uncharacterized protein (TIGR04255 family)
VEHYPNPPIQEALIDIQVTAPPDFTAEKLKSTLQGLENQFPEIRENVQLIQGFQLSVAGENQSFSSSRSVDGYLFISNAAKKTVQARRDSFTFNKLRPYTEWKEFKAEAKELWQRYSELVQPVAIRRLGLRYINRIELPHGLLDLREFCLLFPDIPQPIPQGLAEFFQRFIAPKDNGLISAVSLALDYSNPNLRPAIILDIDVFFMVSNAGLESESMWAGFEEMRVLKNEIFSASLTQKAKALFQ